MNNNNQLAPRQKMSLNQYLRAPNVVTKLSEKLGNDEAKLFGAALSSAVATNKKLLECTPESIINTGLIGHSLKLPPSYEHQRRVVVDCDNLRLGRRQNLSQVL